MIEFARNVLGIKDADSTEFNPGTPNPAVVFMPEISTKHMGGTMRLGARRTVLQSVNCLTAKLYQKERFVDERHRHRCVCVWRGGSDRFVALPVCLGGPGKPPKHCGRGSLASSSAGSLHAQHGPLLCLPLLHCTVITKPKPQLRQVRGEP